MCPWCSLQLLHNWKIFTNCMVFLTKIQTWPVIDAATFRTRTVFKFKCWISWVAFVEFWVHRVSRGWVLCVLLRHFVPPLKKIQNQINFIILFSDSNEHTHFLFKLSPHWHHEAGIIFVFYSRQSRSISMYVFMLNYAWIYAVNKL